MENKENMIDMLEVITGIKQERNEKGFENIFKFTEDYKKTYTKKLKERFGDATTDEVIALFLRENNN